MHRSPFILEGGGGRDVNFWSSQICILGGQGVGQGV